MWGWWVFWLLWLQAVSGSGYLEYTCFKEFKKLNFLEYPTLLGYGKCDHPLSCEQVCRKRSGVSESLSDAHGIGRFELV